MPQLRLDERLQLNVAGRAMKSSIENRDALPPLLRWAGSKRQQLSTLEQYWSPSHDRRYIEPFAGSACLFFRLRPSVAILADLNEPLIDLYEEVRTNPDGVADALASFPLGSNAYYAIRMMAAAGLGSATRAARFIYLNRFCFNGLFRTNANGDFNVPYGGDKAGRLPVREELHKYAAALRAVDLRCSDFAFVASEARPGDFIYLDPPYAQRAVWRRGVHYSTDAFSPGDIPRLKTVLEDITRAGATFLVSYALSEEAHLLAAGYGAREISVRRSIAGSVRHRGNASELIVTNRSLSPGEPQ